MSMLVNGSNNIPKNINGLIVSANYGQKFSKGISTLQGKNELSYLERQSHLNTLNEFGVKFSELSMEDKSVVLQDIGEKFVNFNSLLSSR